jgi:hypothetical protein
MLDRIVKFMSHCENTGHSDYEHKRDEGGGMGTPDPRWPGPRLALLLSLLALAAPALAMDIFPDGVMPAPAGRTATSLFLAHVERDSQYAQGQRLALKASLDSDHATLKLVHFIDLDGHPVQFVMLLPYGRQHAGADTAALGRASGWGDLGLAANYWVVSDAATQWELSANVFLPTGQYVHTQPLNMGEHRHKFVLLMGLNQRLSSALQGVIAADVSVYGDNTQFGSAGVRMQQARTYQLQGFLRCQATAQVEVNAGLSRVWGGEREVAGVTRNDALATNKFLLGASGMLMPATHLSLLYSRDMAVRQGFREAGRITMRLTRLF